MKSKPPSGVARRIRQGSVLMTNRRRSSTDIAGGTISFSGSAPINDPPGRSCVEGRLGNCTSDDTRRDPPTPVELAPRIGNSRLTNTPIRKVPIAGSRVHSPLRVTLGFCATSKIRAQNQLKGCALERMPQQQLLPIQWDRALRLWTVQTLAPMIAREFCQQPGL